MHTRSVFRPSIRSAASYTHVTVPTIAMRQRHTFAPLGQKPRTKDELELRGVVFDMDGTLCLPQNYMFSEMRQACAIPTGEDILDYIHSLPEAQQKEAFAKIQDIERRAMAEQQPQAGLVQLMEFLDANGIKKGICTRNFDTPVRNLLSNHLPGHLRPFTPIVTRAFRPPKPSPAGILHIAQAWELAAPPAATEDDSSTPALGQVQPLPIVMVGDSVDDMAAGRDAGALTVLLRSDGKQELETDERTDIVVSRLDDLIALMKQGLSPK